MALATMVVVAIAVLGSLTVLPAVLAKLGDRVDRGRLPGLQPRGARDRRRLGPAGRRRHAPPAGRADRSPCACSARSPSPALDMKTSGSGALAAADRAGRRSPSATIERAFPGAPSEAELVVTGGHLDSAPTLRDLGRARSPSPAGAARSASSIARDGRTAARHVPMPDRGDDARSATIAELRAALPANVLVTGEAAGSLDFIEPAARPRRRS